MKLILRYSEWLKKTKRKLSSYRLKPEDSWQENTSRKKRVSLMIRINPNRAAEYPKETRMEGQEQL